MKATIVDLRDFDCADAIMSVYEAWRTVRQWTHNACPVRMEGNQAVFWFTEDMEVVGVIRREADGWAAYVRPVPIH